MTTLLTPREVATLLRISQDTVRACIRRRELRAVLVSSSSRSRKPLFRVRQEDLDTFIRARTLVARPAPRSVRRGANYERIV